MTLRLILGDQLNLKHSWFEKQDENTIYVLYELHQVHGLIFLTGQIKHNIKLLNEETFVV
jgi:deoxyribodipyrimidine photolyase-related protein